MVSNLRSMRLISPSALAFPSSFNLLSSPARKLCNDLGCNSSACAGLRATSFAVCDRTTGANCVLACFCAATFAVSVDSRGVCAIRALRSCSL
ncbi:hypothetical protein DOTSEDRAFT_70965 [Dothistroma septosporum NZE10]|uniref:Uncharacterized protein n=1 Tax=Dothistroma septosporum (strain NZE10 / CBS 128990) TaxID=675120 RepID=N1PRP1_DOTSN|nr:hypothetical protein DOTSEDRAFT_70965 [Dothistroma septosporum NZE10]